MNMMTLPDSKTFIAKLRQMPQAKFDDIYLSLISDVEKDKYIDK